MTHNLPKFLLFRLKFHNKYRVNIYLNFHGFAGAMCLIVYISLILEKYEKLNTEFFLKTSSAVCIYLVGFAIYEILSEIAISAYKYNNNNFLINRKLLLRA